MIKKILLSLLAVIALGSCKDEDTSDNVTQIGLDALELYFEKDGNAVDGVSGVNVKSNSDWLLVGEAAWCAPSVTKGTGDELVTFEVEPNESTELRTCIYRFVSGDKNVQFIINQFPEGWLTPLQSKFMISDKGGDIKVPVQANVEYDFEIADDAKDWIKPRAVSESTPDSGVSYLRFNIASYSGYNTVREGIITLKSNDAPDAVITVKQDKAIRFHMDQTSYELEPEGGEITLRLESTIPYTWNIPDDYKDWVEIVSETTKTEENLKILSIVLKIGEATFSRNATIQFNSIFKNYDVSIKQKGGSSKIIEKTSKNSDFIDLMKNLGLISQVSGTTDKYELTKAGFEVKELELKEIKWGRERIVITGTITEEIKYFEKLEYLFCGQNSIKTIDVSHLKKLRTLDLSGNRWSEIILGEAPIKTLTFGNYGFRSRGDWYGDISEGCVISGQFLEEVVADKVDSKEDLPYLDLSGCPNLKKVSCYDSDVNSDTGKSYCIRRLILPKALEGQVVVNKESTVVEYK